MYSFFLSCAFYAATFFYGICFAAQSAIAVFFPNEEHGSERYRTVGKACFYFGAVFLAAAVVFQRQLSMDADSQLSAANTKLTTVGAQLTAANSKLKTVEAQLAAANDKLKTVEAQLTAANDKLKTVEAQLTDANDKLKTVEAQLTVANDKLKTVEAQLTAAEADAMRKQEELLAEIKRLKKLLEDSVTVFPEKIGYYRFPKGIEVLTALPGLAEPEMPVYLFLKAPGGYYMIGCIADYGYFERQGVRPGEGQVFLLKMKDPQNKGRIVAKDFGKMGVSTFFLPNGDFAAAKAITAEYDGESTTNHFFEYPSKAPKTVNVTKK